MDIVIKDMFCFGLEHLLLHARTRTFLDISYSSDTPGRTLTLLDDFDDTFALEPWTMDYYAFGLVQLDIASLLPLHFIAHLTYNVVLSLLTLYLLLRTVARFCCCFLGIRTLT